MKTSRFVMFWCWPLNKHKEKEKLLMFIEFFKIINRRSLYFSWLNMKQQNYIRLIHILRSIGYYFLLCGRLEATFDTMWMFHLGLKTGDYTYKFCAFKISLACEENFSHLLEDLSRYFKRITATITKQTLVLREHVFLRYENKVIEYD